MGLELMKKTLREMRKFEPEFYLKRKVEAINKFFKDNSLDACVIGVSGGIDSAVVFKLMKLASQEPDSPIKVVKGIMMPIYDCSGVTGQSNATHFGSLLSPDIEMFNLGDVAKEYLKFFPSANAWTQGQLASIVRTPMLYGGAAFLQQQGYNSIVVGTTNRDEGSYIGFYGKASDAMVDLQPIADIHKSEVYAIAELLEVPKEIIDRAPMGDVHDGSTDEHTIGAPYWALECYLLIKQFIADNTWFDPTKIHSMLDEEELKEWETYCQNIEAIHEKNSHKYKVGLPSHFIDVMERKIPKGW